MNPLLLPTAMEIIKQTIRADVTAFGSVLENNTITILGQDGDECGAELKNVLDIPIHRTC